MKDFPRNPMLVHKIQDALQKLEIGKELEMVDGLAMAILCYRDLAIVPLITILHDKKDRESVVKIIGKETMALIDEYMEGEETPEPDPNDLKGVNI